jgi:tetratricopeptide (TPR) repeat protein
MADSALRILVITSRPLVTESGEPISLLDVETERRRISEGLQKSGIAALVHFLPEATTREVQHELSKPWDVVHFTGHGTDEGSLVLEDGFGVAHLLSAADTAKMFTERDVPIVFLSACFSEAVGSKLIAAGVHSVIAIDATTPIADYAAILFAEHFYRAFAQQRTIRKAFEEAQNVVAIDPEVGDDNPPVDQQGKEEEVWSKRFKLLGDATKVIAATSGDYHEEGAQKEALGNLRPRNENFVGRAAEIVRVVEAFDKAHKSRVALFGPGGLGKTELSKAVAWWYVERNKVNAVLWSSASRDEGEYQLRDLSSLLSIATTAFNLPVSEQSMFEERKRVAREFFKTNRVLVIFDNWETIETKDKVELWDFAMSLTNSTRLLVTSRNELPAKDARNIRLNPLTRDDAVKLFAQVARNAGYFEHTANLTWDERQMIYRICDHLSGYTLAVEVIAGLTGRRSLKEIWDDLQQHPKEVLESIDEVKGEPRGVWTSLDLSYDVLKADEKAMFRRMCVFLAPASSDDIAKVTGIEKWRIALDALVRQALVQIRGDEYSLLPVMRFYAESKLEESGEDVLELHARATSHYKQIRTLESFLKASGHLYELASHYNSRQAAESFAEFVSGFYQALVTQGYWIEARQKAEQLVEIARVLSDRESEMVALYELANMFYRVGEYQRSTETLKEVKRISEEIDNKKGLAATLHQMGIIAEKQGDYTEAMRFCEESLKIENELGNKSGIALTLSQMANISYLKSDYAEAMRLYEESLKINKELGDKSSIAGTLHGLGMLAQEQGDYVGAIKLYEESLKINKELKNKNSIAATLGQMGRLAAVQEKLKEALAHFLNTLLLFEQLGSPYRIKARKDIANVRARAGDEQFVAWLRELSIDDESIQVLLEQTETTQEGLSEEEFFKGLLNLAQTVVQARAEGNADEQAALAAKLTQIEDSVRQQGGAEVADFIAVMRLLLAGEEAADKIAALVEPFKELAEQTLEQIMSS